MRSQPRAATEHYGGGAAELQHAVNQCQDSIFFTTPSAFYTTKPEGSGTGLGLSMVYGIVRQSEGFISAHCEAGEGTTFKIYFPVAAPAAPQIAGASPAEKPVHGGSETLPVVEDEAAVRQSEVEFLSTIGYTVLSAANGRSSR